MADLYATCEIELDDGTICRWGGLSDAQVQQVEDLLGPPDTMVA